MKIERIILISVFVVVVFVAIIALFVYKTFTPSTGVEYEVKDNNSQDIGGGNGGENQKPTTTNPTATSSTPDSADSHTAIDDCIELKANEARGKDYEKGSLLVSFFDALQYDTALETIRLFGLRPDTSVSAKDNFNLYHWLPVAVPSGEEFKWQCTLDSSEGIKRANLNITFNLRQ